MAIGQPVLWALVIYVGMAAVMLTGYLTVRHVHHRRAVHADIAQHVRHIRTRTGSTDQEPKPKDDTVA